VPLCTHPTRNLCSLHGDVDQQTLKVYCARSTLGNSDCGPSSGLQISQWFNLTNEMHANISGSQSRLGLLRKVGKRATRQLAPRLIFNSQSADRTPVPCGDLMPCPSRCCRCQASCVHFSYFYLYNISRNRHRPSPPRFFGTRTMHIILIGLSNGATIIRPNEQSCFLI
jgi:hypothetical protein